MEEYFESDVKSEEVDFTEIKHEFISDDKKKMEEYIERDVKFEVESNVEFS